MADKVYPAAKPGPAPAGTISVPATNGAFPATKSQLYGASRPAYRLPAPLSRKSKHRRGCCCRCCLWTTVVLLTVIFLAAVAGVVVYILYSPHRPTFTVSSLKISILNLTSSSNTLTTDINMNITTRNPNKKLVYVYSPITITLKTSSNDVVVLGTGSVPGFVHGKKNTTYLQVAVRSNGKDELDDTSAKNLKAELKNKNGVGLKVITETKVKVKLGGVKLPKVGIRVTCDGIKGSVPTGKTATSASLGSSKCKVDLRVKIWKWTF